MPKLSINDEATLYHPGTNTYYRALIKGYVSRKDLEAESHQGVDAIEPTKATTAKRTPARDAILSQTQERLVKPFLMQEEYEAAYLAFSALTQDLRDQVSEQLKRSHTEMALDRSLTPDQQIERGRICTLWTLCNQVSLDFRDLYRTKS